MNESILAYRAWQSINENIDRKISIYFNIYKEMSDLASKLWADEICDEYDKLVPVLEWLEKKFE